MRANGYFRHMCSNQTREIYGGHTGGLQKIVNSRMSHLCEFSSLDERDMEDL